MAKGYCPLCKTQLNLGGAPRKGQGTKCTRCGASLKVSALSPIEMDLADEELEREDSGLSDSIDRKYRAS
jgi:hypothetical protein